MPSTGLVLVQDSDIHLQFSTADRQNLSAEMETKESLRRRHCLWLLSSSAAGSSERRPGWHGNFGTISSDSTKKLGTQRSLPRHFM